MGLDKSAFFVRLGSMEGKNMQTIIIFKGGIKNGKWKIKMIMEKGGHQKCFLFFHFSVFASTLNKQTNKQTNKQKNKWKQIFFSFFPTFSIFVLGCGHAMYNV